MKNQIRAFLSLGLFAVLCACNNGSSGGTSNFNSVNPTPTPSTSPASAIYISGTSQNASSIYIPG